MFLEISQNSQQNTCARDSSYKCFPVNFAKFLKAPFLQNTSGRLLLNQLQNIIFLTASKLLLNLLPVAEKIVLFTCHLSVIYIIYHFHMKREGRFTILGKISLSR